MKDEAPNPFPSYFAALLRTVGGMIGGYLIGKGYITADQAPAIGGGVLALIVAAWGVYTRYKASKALQAAIDAPAGKAS